MFTNLFWSFMMEIELFQLILYSSILVASLSVLPRVFFWFQKEFRIRKNLREHWKGPPAHWFYGHIDKASRDNQDPSGIIRYFAEKQKEFPYGFAVYLGPIRAILRVHHPIFAKEVLHSSASDAPKSPLMKLAFAPWLGKGLVIQDGGEWSRQRRLLTYSFHFDVLKAYLSHMNNCTDTLLNKWNILLEKNDQTKIEIFSEASLMTLDTILQCLVSYKSNCQLERTRHPYIASIYAISECIFSRGKSRNPFFLSNFIYFRCKEGRNFLKHCEIAHEFSNSFIKKRREESLKGEDASNREMDFLDTLLQAKDSDGTGFSDYEIRSQLDTFLFGGHDTTACAISWILYALSTHPEYQERCAVEVDAVMGGQADVTWAHLSSFPFLTRCIKEGLRLYPSAPIISRVLNKDIHVEGKTIAKGTTVQVGILEMQKNEEFWKNPNEFNPDRFTLESAVEQNHNAYVPFSAGPRNCIGQNFAMNEIKVVLAKLLRHFRFTLDADHDIVPCLEIVYRSKTGLYLFIEQRK